jgi:hypothetical protein
VLLPNDDDNRSSSSACVTHLFDQFGRHRALAADVAYVAHVRVSGNPRIASNKVDQSIKREKGKRVCKQIILFLRLDHFR